MALTLLLKIKIKIKIMKVFGAEEKKCQTYGNCAACNEHSS